MNRNLFIYFLVLLALYGVAIAYRQTEPIFVLSVLVFVPVISIIVSFILSFSVKAFLVRGNYSASLPNKPTTFRVRLLNRAPIALTKVEIVLLASYISSDKAEKIRTAVTLRAKEQLEVRIPVTYKFCGLAQVRIKKVRVYDWLGLFRWSRRVDQSQSVVVLPEYTMVPVKNRNIIWQDMANASRFHSTLVGDDPSEIVSLHSLQPGDKLQRVHWKLSAKSDDLMVKDFGLPLCSRVCLYIDMNYETRADYSSRMTIALSVGLSLLEAKCPFTLLWFQKDMERHCITVYEIDELYEVFAELMRSSLPISRISMPVVFSEAKLENRMRQFIVVTGEDDIRKEKEELLSAKRTMADELIVLAESIDPQGSSAEPEILARDVYYTFTSDALIRQLSTIELVVM